MFDRPRPRDRREDERPQAAPALGSSAILAPQRSAGNAAVARMLDENANVVDYHMATRPPRHPEAPDATEHVGAFFEEQERQAAEQEAEREDANKIDYYPALSARQRAPEVDGTAHLKEFLAGAEATREREEAARRKLRRRDEQRARQADKQTERAGRRAAEKRADDKDEADRQRRRRESLADPIAAKGRALLKRVEAAHAAVLDGLDPKIKARAEAAGGATHRTDESAYAKLARDVDEAKADFDGHERAASYQARSRVERKLQDLRAKGLATAITYAAAQEALVPAWTAVNGHVTASRWFEADDAWPALATAWAGFGMTNERVTYIEKRITELRALAAPPSAQRFAAAVQRDRTNARPRGRWTSTNVLIDLYARGPTRPGVVQKEYQAASDGQHGHSLELTMEGMQTMTVHLHVTDDGKLADGDNPWHWKLKSEKYEKGKSQKIPRDFAAKLLDEASVQRSWTVVK